MKSYEVEACLPVAGSYPEQAIGIAEAFASLYLRDSDGQRIPYHQLPSFVCESLVDDVAASRLFNNVSDGEYCVHLVYAVDSDMVPDESKSELVVFGGQRKFDIFEAGVGVVK